MSQCNNNIILDLDCQVKTNSNIPNILLDGKNDWGGKKRLSNKIADLVQVYDTDKAFKIRSCASYLQFKRVFESSKLTLHNGIFCRCRVCAMCTWRKSLKLGYQMRDILHYLYDNDRTNYRFLMLTLTVRNCTRDELDVTIDKFLYAFNLFAKRDIFRQKVKGWYRSLEVTYNHDKTITPQMYYDNPDYYNSMGLSAGDDNPNYDTYHPHLHLLLAVPPSYFRAGNRLEVKYWANLWQSCLGVDYSPNIDVRTVSCRDKSKPGANVDRRYLVDFKAICEVTKYPVKLFSIFKVDDDKRVEVLQTIDDCLRSRRLVAFGGVFLEARKALSQQDIESADLVVVDGDESKDYDLPYEVISYTFRNGFYYKDDKDD